MAAVSVHVRVVTPIVPTGLSRDFNFGSFLSPEDTLDLRELDDGPISVESAYDAALAAPNTVAKIIEAEREGVDAVVIDCMGDPGLIAARECVTIPVLGPCQMAMSIACTLGHRFSVLSIARSTHAAFQRRARIYGVADKYASTRSIDIPVAALGANHDLLRARLAGAAVQAIQEDDADTLVIGCTLMFGAAEGLRADLLAKGLDVPVIDPVPMTVRLAKTLVELGLGHSKRAFATPRRRASEGHENVHEALPAELRRVF